MHWMHYLAAWLCDLKASLGGFEAPEGFSIGVQRFRSPLDAGVSVLVFRARA